MTTFVGVDIAKATFDAALPLESGKYRTRSKFSNVPAGHEEFVLWLKQHAPDAAVGMEATGVYHEALAERLVGHGVTVHVINPAQIAAYGKSELLRTKTDRTDAKLIARFCLAQQASRKPLRPWEPLPVAQRRLKALVGRLEDLKNMRQMERNRRGTADTAVHPSLDKVIATFDHQIAEIEKAIKQHIDDDPDLRGDHELITSITALSDASSAHLLANVGNTRQFFKVGEMVATVGIDPRIRESGKWKGQTRISKTGSPQLRAKLYMPALVAMKHNPIVREFCERLRKSGKPAKVIIVAAMRKLLHIVWGVLRSRKPFDPNFLVAR